MKPNLLVGDFLFVSKFSYGFSKYSVPYGRYLPFNGRLFFSKPKRGDIAVFKYPGDNKTDYIKRIIGLPGDTVKINQGKIYLNDIRIKEPYLNNDKYKDLSDFGPVTISNRHVFVLGDNRWVSNDSRNWGVLSYDFIIGEPMIKYWPLK